MLDAKSVSPTTTIEVCAIVPSSFSIGVLPNSEMANESYREKYGLQMAQIPYNFMWVNGYRMSNDGRVMEDYECEVADVIIATKDMDENETKKAWTQPLIPNRK